MNTDGLEKGYIKIFRKIRKSLVWPNKKELSLCEVWIDILMEVQYSEIPKPVLIGLRPVIQNQGECLYSVATWADRWNMTRSKANRVLTLFQDCDMIRTKSEHKTTRLTVCNYRDYADWRTDGEQIVNTWRTDGEQIVNTTLEGKETNKGNKGDTTAASEQPDAPDDTCDEKAPEAPKKQKKKRAPKASREIIYTESFLRFWRTWWKKANKEESMESWAAIDPDDEKTEFIISSLIFQQENGHLKPKPPDKKAEWFHPVATTWLNNHRYNDFDFDDYDSEPTHQGSLQVEEEPEPAPEVSPEDIEKLHPKECEHYKTVIVPIMREMYEEHTVDEFLEPLRPISITKDHGLIWCCAEWFTFVRYSHTEHVQDAYRELDTINPGFTVEFTKELK